MAVTRNLNDSRKSQHTTGPVKATMIDIIDDTDNIGPSLPLTVTTTGHKFTARTKHLTQAAWMQVYGNRYCIWYTLREELPRIIRILIFLETTIIALHFAADII